MTKICVKHRPRSELELFSTLNTVLMNKSAFESMIYKPGACKIKFEFNDSKCMFTGNVFLARDHSYHR